MAIIKVVKVINVLRYANRKIKGHMEWRLNFNRPGINTRCSQSPLHGRGLRGGWEAGITPYLCTNCW